MSVPVGSERRELTVEILYLPIFIGINTFNPQRQIKYESKNRVQVMKNGEQVFILLHIMKTGFMN